MKRGALYDAVVEACALDLRYREMYSCKQLQIRAKGGHLKHTPNYVLLTSAQGARSCRSLRNYVSVRGDFRQ